MCIRDSSCNQTLATMLTCQLTRGLYGDDRQRLALDMEDSVIVTAGLIPWSIAAAVPLAALGVGNGALLYAFYDGVDPEAISGNYYPLTRNYSFGLNITF